MARRGLRIAALTCILLGFLSIIVAAIVAVIGYPQTWFLWDGILPEDKWPLMRTLVITGLLGGMLLLLGISLWRTGTSGLLSHYSLAKPTKRQYVVAFEGSGDKRIVVPSPKVETTTEAVDSGTVDWLGLIIAIVGAVALVVALILFGIYYPEAWYPADDSDAQTGVLRATASLSVFGFIVMFAGVMLSNRADRTAMRSLARGRLDA